MFAILLWTPFEFIAVIPATVALSIVAIGIATTLSEMIERRLRKCSTEKETK